MKTAFQHGPGFYAVMSHGHNRRVPQGMVRIYLVRLEAYDIPQTPGIADETEWQILFAQAEGNPEIAFAILQLGDAIQANRESLKKEARR